MQVQFQKDQENERINFEDEIKIFMKDNLIKGYEMVEVSPIFSRIKITTLEDYHFVVTNEVGKGITVEESSAPVDMKRFDSFEQLFARYSHAYNQAFNESLNAKLLSYAEQQSHDNNDN